MKKKIRSIICISLLLSLTVIQAIAGGSLNRYSCSTIENKINYLPIEDYEGQVTFPAGFVKGDYIEFLKTAPISAGASGNYEISISYLRNSMAAAATYLASVSHGNSNLWREVGRVNSNGFGNSGSDGHNFTVDFNTQYGSPRIRIRAINTFGDPASPLTVYIKVRSINANTSWTALNVTGNDLTVIKLLPMTNDWSLYVGNPYKTDGAQIAIKAIENGNVGIGTSNPDSKLSVNGNIRAKEIKVEAANWPDYVFTDAYKLPALADIERHIKEKGHLPEIQSAAEVERNGVNLGEINARLLKKIEELTLYLIQENKINMKNTQRLEAQELQIRLLIDKLNSFNGERTKN